jgi:hypothetical protein
VAGVKIAVALVSLLAAVALAGCGGGSSSDTTAPSAAPGAAATAAASAATAPAAAPTTAARKPNPNGKVLFRLGRCVGDPGGQLVCTDGRGLTMPAPRAGSHDEDGCTWSVRGSGLRAVYLCRADG